MCKIFSRDLFQSILHSKNTLVAVEIVPTPSDATVTLQASGYQQSGNTIVVPIGTVLSWSVSRDPVGDEFFQPRSGRFIVSGKTTMRVALSSLPTKTISIATVPQDTVVTLSSSEGYENDPGTKAITVPVGTKLHYAVSYAGLQPTDGDIVVQEDKEIQVTLKNKIQITPTPPDATVKINGEATTIREQECNAVVNWSVERNGYVSRTGTIPLNEQGVVLNSSLSIELALGEQPLTVTVSPSTATITINANGETFVGTGALTVNLFPGQSATITASLDGYDDYGPQEITMGTAPYPVSIDMRQKEFSVEVSASPAECFVELYVDGEQKASGVGRATVSAVSGTRVLYLVKYEEAEESGEIVVLNANVSKQIVLNNNETLLSQVSIVTDSQSVELSPGRYSCILFGAGGPGGAARIELSQNNYFGSKTSCGGGGGSGYIQKGTFLIEEKQVLSFFVAKHSGENTYIRDSRGATVVSASSGEAGLDSGNGGNGGCGGGAGGKSAIKIETLTNMVVIPVQGGNGGRGGFNGTSIAHTAGTGIKKSNGDYSENGGNRGSTSASTTTINYGECGGGGLGCASIKDRLLDPEYFDSITADELYGFMSGGGGGGGNYVYYTRTSLSSLEVPSQCGGGGGAWTDGSPGVGNGVPSTPGAGGTGAILYRRISWE